MLEFFTNPSYLAAGGALVSAPIIIHLINRLRFKRIQWAAMEFLLKSQKKNRRRLIIEQIILLLLRCLLVLLVGLLVARFLGFSLAGGKSAESLNIVLLDDTLSMTDQHRQQDGKTSTAFDRAKDKSVFEQIVKNLSRSTTKENLMIIPLSTVAIDPDAKLKKYEGIDANTVKRIKTDLEELKPSAMHVNLLAGVKRVQKITQDNPRSKITFFIVSDFRKSDWGAPYGEEIDNLLVTMAKSHNNLTIRPTDPAHPYRNKGHGGYPKAHDNVAIVDFRAGTRVAGVDMPVLFNLTVRNYSNKRAEVHIGLYEGETGQEMLDVDFQPTLPLTLPPNGEQTFTFEKSFHPEIKEGDRHYVQLMAQIQAVNRGPLRDDGVLEDNNRYVSLEIRRKVPVLVIDGESAAGREHPGDSFYLHNAIVSVPGASYKVVYGDVLAGGVSTKALERPDLRDYPTIFLLNVRDLNDKQLDNLEKYVQEGGGVAFFLGPNVSPDFYNKKLYKNGSGLFPTPLSNYYPAENAPKLELEYTGTPQLLLRDTDFPKNNYPVFGPVFEDPTNRLFLVLGFPVNRYFPVPRQDWKKTPGQDFELATLPNSKPIDDYNKTARDLIHSDILNELLLEKEFSKYGVAVDRHRLKIDRIIEPGSEKKAYHLGNALDEFLTDSGRKSDREQFPDLTKLWGTADPKIRTLRSRISKLRDEVRFGDPFAVLRYYGKGKVMAIMTTAGTTWNAIADGSVSQRIYQPIIWELQHFLSSQSEKAVREVGTPINISIDNTVFGQRNLKLVQYYYPVKVGEQLKPKQVDEDFGQTKKDAKVFEFSKSLNPGLYVSRLLDANDPAAKTPLAEWSHTFNVNAEKESNLERASSKLFEELSKNSDGKIIFHGINDAGSEFITRKSDMSESPWFFLLILGVLIAEQALAVHLSFHLRGNEAAAPTAARPQGRAA